ncbi:MAG: beta-glucosidase [Acidobacteriota bacterium]|nr:beta-glucosidase [Acidobacteriota bacterium]
MANSTSRRDFLRLTAMAGVAALSGRDLIARKLSRPESNESNPSGASPTLKSFTAYREQARALLSQMTLEEKVGQMTQAEQDALKDFSDIKAYALGSLLSGGSSDPKAGNSLLAWTDLYDRTQTEALKSRLAVPLLYGIDAVHGHNNVLGATVFPHNVGLGCTRNPKLVEEAARITAYEVRATGINWAFAPCVTVPRDKRWGRTYEGFGEAPELVRAMAEAAVRGLQSDDLNNPLSVLACAKHWVGDGGTKMGTGTFGYPKVQKMLDQGDTQLSESDLLAVHAQGYLGAIKAGIGSIMPSYSSWNGVKLSASKRLMTEILKQQMKFDGFLISDYNALDQITPDFKEAIAMSINAGMDMVMVPKKYREFHGLLVALAKEGGVSQSRIDEAVMRILQVKIAMGLMDKSRSVLADRKLHAAFGSTEHRQVARQCVRESLVLLKNERRILPLAKTATRIHVSGRNADDIGNQCGGWTIDWQGKSGKIIPGGTTILEAIKNTVSPKTRLTFSLDGTGAEGADVAVVVIGETPYAEGRGDRADLSLDAADVAAVNNLSSAGVPVVIVLVSGRPLLIEQVLSKSRAFIAAWLPGSEGQGVADVLFGERRPTGKLSMTFPRSMADSASNVGDKNYAPLFKYGSGLSY